MAQALFAEPERRPRRARRAPMPTRCSTAAAHYPGDDDIALLAAESVMDTRPWDYWEADKRRRSRGSATAVGWSRRCWRAIPTIRRRPSLHPPDRERARSRSAPRPPPTGSPRRSLAERRPSGPHAGAHLLPARPLGGFDPGQCRRGPRRRGLYPGQPATRAWSATAIIRTTSTSSSPRRRWPATCRPRSREARRLAPDRSTPTSARRSAGSRRSTPRPISRPRNSPRRSRSWRCGAPDARLPYVVAMRHYARARGAMRRAAQPSRLRAGARRARARSATGTALQPMIDQGVPAADLLQLAEPVARARWAYGAGPLSTRPSRSTARRRDRRQAPLYGAALLVLSGPSVAGRGLVPRRPLRRGESRPLGGARPSPKNGWALWPRGVRARARPPGRGGGGPGGARPRLDRRPAGSGWIGSRRPR